ncbi:MAG TPA: hypothetical protein VFM31_12900 [Nitrososphaeraceae archaeon]|nr:hypothetical protein [Nitrososphaeraceae archaeon]
MIKLVGILTAIFLLINTVSIGAYGQISMESYAQINSTNESDRKSVNSTDTKESTARLNVTKTVHCDSSLGIPSDESVCKFVLDNVDASQFDLIVTDNQSQANSFQGSSNGTIINLNEGSYTIKENPFNTMDVENQLGETAIVTMDTDANGDCVGQFNQVDNFETATGSIEQGQTQMCEIINTISVTEGSSPEEP